MLLATFVLGKASKKWGTNDIPDLCDKRTNRMKRKDHPVAMRNYSEVNKETRRRMKEANEHRITDRCNELDSGIRTRHIKAAVDIVKLLTRQQSLTTKLI